MFGWSMFSCYFYCAWSVLTWILCASRNVVVFEMYGFKRGLVLCLCRENHFFKGGVNCLGFSAGITVDLVLLGVRN